MFSVDLGPANRLRVRFTNRARLTGLVLTLCSVLLLPFYVAVPAQSQTLTGSNGGNGGDGKSVGQSGLAGSGVNAAFNSNATWSKSGKGGVGAKPGTPAGSGSGGLADGSVSALDTAAGGGGAASGGGGGIASSGWGGGGGGGGANGATYGNKITTAGVGATIFAGNGGNGGNGLASDPNGYAYGGGGGGGGIGVIFEGASKVSINPGLPVRGGNGGNGGNGARGSNGPAAYGGSGGVGGDGILVITTTGISVNVDANVTGGNGGAAGANAGSPTGTLPTAGAGGVGIRGSNLYMTINAQVSGGLSGDLSNQVRANAITLNGGSNVLLLGSSGSLVGGISVEGSLTIDQAVDKVIDGAIVGGGSIEKKGIGTLSLSGANTYSGSTTVSVGTLQIGNGGTSGSISGDVSVSSGATFAFNRSDDVTFANAINGAGGFTKNGSGTLTLTGTNTYSGSTTVSSGILQIGDGNAAGSIASASNISILTGATLAFNRSDDVTFSNKITGAGGLTKNGNKTLILTGASTYSGTTNVTSGVLQAGGINKFSSASVYNITSTLDLAGFDQSISGLSGLGTVTNSGTNDATLTVGGNDTDSLFSGVVQDGASSKIGLTKAGKGTFTLTGSNIYTGSTLVSAGTLQIGDGKATGSINTDVSVLSGATLAFNRSDDVTFGKVVTGAGGLTKSGGGTLTLSGANTYTGSTTVSAGTLQIGNGGITGSINSDVSVLLGATLAFNRSDDVTFGNFITGSGGLTKNGSGTLTLTGIGLYSGMTNVSSGVLQAGAANRFSKTSIYNVTSTLDLAGYSQSVRALSGTGTVTNSGTSTAELWARGSGTNITFSGVIRDGDNATTSLKVDGLSSTQTLTGTNTYTGGTTVSAGTLQIGDGGISGSIVSDVSVSSGATLAFNRSDNVTYSNKLSSGGTVTKLGNGTLTLSGDNSSFTGTLNINQGTLAFTTANAIKGNVSLNGGTLQAGVDNATLSNLFSVEANSVIDTNNNALNLSGALSNSSVVSLTKKGAGTLSLTGSGTGLSANLIVQEGTLSVDTVGRLGSGSLLTLGGTGTVGTLKYTGIAATLNKDFLLTGNGGIIDNSGDLTVGGSLSGGSSAAFTKIGAGTLTLTGTNTYIGSTTVSAGTLQIGYGGVTGSITGDVSVSSGATFAFNRSDAVTFSNVISGTGGFTKNGTGTLILTGANTYSGGTTVSSGTLQIGDGGATGSISGDVSVSSNATFAFNRSDAVTFSNVISGTGGFTKTGSGTLTLTGTNTYSGSTTVSSGILQVGDGGTTGSITSDVSVSSGATLAFNRSGALAFSNVISGGGGFTKNGNGTLTLTGTNTYTGGTTVSVGTLQIGNGGTTGSINSNVTVSSGATLAFNRSNTVNFANAISGTGGLTKMGAGTLILTGASTYSGTTNVTSGVLQAGGANKFSSASAYIVTSTLDIGGYDQSISSLSGTGIVTNIGANNATLTVGGDNTSTLFSGIVQDGGISSKTNLTKTGTGTLTLTGTNTYTGGTTVLLGTLQIGDGDKSGSINSDVTVSLGSTITFNRSDTVTYANKVTGAGGLTKAGSGILNLTGTNDYSGPTIINAGQLRVNGSLSNSDVTVNNGGALGGSGTLGGSVTVNGGGILAAGNSPGTLTIQGNLTLNSTSISQFELGAPGYVGGALNDLVKVGGNLTLGGTLQLSNQNQAITAGYYRLFNYGGTKSGSFASTTIAGGAAGDTATVLMNVPGQINLLYKAGGQSMLFFTGGNNTSGNTGDTPGTTKPGGGAGDWSNAATQWTTAPPLGSTATSPGSDINDGWQQGVAIFTGTGASVTIDDKSGAINVEGIQFAANNYRLTGGALTLVGNSAGNSSASFIRVDSGFVATIESNLVGSKGLEKTGDGTLVLSGVNSYSGVTLVSVGTLKAGAENSFNTASAHTVTGTLDLGGYNQNIASLSGTGTVTNNGTNAATLTVGGDNSSTSFSGVIQDGGVSSKTNLTKAGSGTFKLTGSNIYTGNTSVSSGTLQIGDGGTTGSITGDVSVSSGATLAFNRAGAVTYANSVTGAGSFIKNGTGTLILTGANNVTGGTVVSSGTLQIGNGGTTGSITGGISVSSGATLAFNRAGDLIFANTISGAGGVTKNGTGSLILSGVNTYTGTTSVSSGILKAGAENSFNAASAHTVTGTLDLAGYNQIIGSLSGTGIVANSGTNNVTLSAGGNNTSTTFSGAINDGTNSKTGFTKSGTGTLTLSGANTYSGDSTVLAGVLKGGAENSFSAASAYNVASTLDLGGYHQMIGSLSGSGTVTNSGTNNATLTAGGNSIDTTFSGSITDGTSFKTNFTKSGTGSLTLTGSNTYSGATTVSAGLLRVNGSLNNSAVTVNSGGTLGGSGMLGAVTVTSDGSLSVSQGSSSVSSLTIKSLTLQSGAKSVFRLDTPVLGAQASVNDFINVTGALTLGGSLQLRSGTSDVLSLGTYRLFGYNTQSGAFTSFLDNAGTDISAQVSVNSANGYYNLKIASGSQQVQTWNGASSWNQTDFAWIGSNTSAQTWQEGVAIFSGLGGKSVTVQPGVKAQGLRFTADGYMLSGQLALSGNAEAMWTNQTTFDVDEGVSASVSAILSGTDSSKGLVKLGNGTLTLSGSNTYQGGTWLEAGTLVVENAAALGTGALTMEGGTLALRSTPSLSLANDVKLAGDNVVEVASTQFTLSGLISNKDVSTPGRLIKTGAGTLALANSNNDFSGGTLIRSGTIFTNNDGALGTGGLAIEAGGGGRLDLQSKQTISSLNGGGSVNQSGQGQVILGNGGTLTINNSASDNSIFRGIFSGTNGQLIKSGEGTLTLMGNSQAFMGQTTLAGGTLAIGDNLALGGGQLSFQKGTLTVVADGLVLANAIDLSATNGVIATQSSKLTLTGTISGSGGLTKTGAGTLTLTGNNTYSGATVLTAGTLAVNGTLANSAVTIQSGASLSGIGIVNAVNAASGSFVLAGDRSTMGVAGGTLGMASLIMEKGATFDVRFDAAQGTYDKANVTGIATITGGILNINASPSDSSSSAWSTVYKSKQKYTVLTANTLTGTFDKVTTNLAFLKPTVDYSATKIDVSFDRNGVDYTSVALTENQKNVARALKAASDTGVLSASGQKVIDKINANVIIDKAPQALSALSGEQVPTLQTAALFGSNRLAAVINTQALSALNGPGSMITIGNALAYMDDSSQQTAILKATTPKDKSKSNNASKAQPVAERTWRVWASTFGGMNETFANNNNPRVTGSDFGGAVGFDRVVAPGLTAGFSFGGTSSSSSIDNGTTKGNFDAGHVSLYGLAEAGSVYLSAALGYGRYSASSTRTVAGIGSTEIWKGDYGANGYSGNVEFGYRYRAGAYQITPFAGLHYNVIDQETYSEKSDDPAAAFGLTYASIKTSSMPASLGVQIESDLGTRKGWQITGLSRFIYVHEFNTNRSIMASFNNLPGYTYEVAGISPDSGSGRVTAGLTFVDNQGSTIYTSFTGDVSQNSRSGSLQAGYRYQW